jgi:hypothetical protein
MKRTISILMIAMMILTSGAFAAYADAEGNAADDQVLATEEAAVEEAVEEQAEPAAEEAVVEEEAVEEEAVVEEVEEEVVEEQVMAKPAKNAAMRIEAPTVQVDSVNVGKATVTWTAITDFAFDVYLDDKKAAEGITTGSYEITGLKAGSSHKVYVEGKTADGQNLATSEVATFEIPKIGNVGRVSVYGGYNAVHVVWTPVEGAVKYHIYKAAKKANNTYDPSLGEPHSVIDAATAEKVTTPFAGYTRKFKNTGTVAYYKVFAEDANGNISAVSPVDGSSKIRYITYTFVLKTSKTLTSHDGYNKKHTFPKGMKITATAFGEGKYKFYYKIGGKSYYFYCTAISTKSATADYKKSGNYSKTAAEFYVNDVGYKSPTNYLLWTSLYCQHTYVFQKKSGKWVCIRDFECGSGSAKAPSPSGASKQLIAGPGTEKKPGKKYYRKGHGRRYYWSPFSSWNSYHSVKLNKAGKALQTLGYPASKGCIRVALVNAEYIYKLPRTTKVAVL